MLSSQIMQHFRIVKDWSGAGYFETTQLQQFERDIRMAVLSGKLIAITGAVGAGKTAMLSRLQDRIASDKKIIVARVCRWTSNALSCLR